MKMVQLLILTDAGFNSGSAPRLEVQVSEC